MFPSAVALALALALLGTRAAAQSYRLSSPILGSQPAAAAGDRDVAAISKGSRAAAHSPKNRLSSPILGSQPAAAPAGDRDVAAISKGSRAAAQHHRLSSPILGSQPAAAPAGDRDVAEITNYEQRRVLSGYVMTDSNFKTAVAA